MALIDNLNKLEIHDLICAKTSDYVKEAKDLIGIPIKRKFAYSVNGNIYLDTSKFKTYGVLSHLSKKELSAQRYDNDINKRSITDIFLWNASDNYGIEFITNTIIIKASKTIIRSKNLIFEPLSLVWIFGSLYDLSFDLA
jgi:cysteinyl-tRNA synthetase